MGAELILRKYFHSYMGIFTYRNPMKIDVMIFPKAEQKVVSVKIQLQLPFLV